MMPIALNGRFLTQKLTGVQRVATEITRALDALPGAPPIELLAPPGATAPGLARIALRHVGRGGGQGWEQACLPTAVRGRLLVSLGNTAPLALGRAQAVLIHDAGAFDTPESYGFAFRSWYRLLHRGLAFRGARILTVSEFSRGRIAHHLGIDPAAIGVIPEGAEHILREPADTGALARLGLVAGRYVLTVGTGAAHKNLAALAAARDLLAARGLTLAAVGAADPSVFSGAGHDAGAVALGRVSDAALRALYEGALCLVFPSRYEGFGLPPVEAMACSCPVVASPMGAVPEVCGEAALWFDPAAPESLAARLAELIDTPDLAQRLRAAGAARVRVYTWPAAARALLSHLGFAVQEAA